jgi:hypothetical protein
MKIVSNLWQEHNILSQQSKECYFGFIDREQRQDQQL